VSRASTGLCGGQWATAVPTATRFDTLRVDASRARSETQQESGDILVHSITAGGVVDAPREKRRHECRRGRVCWACPAA
jgi:hypothetical protein